MSQSQGILVYRFFVEPAKFHSLHPYYWGQPMTSFNNYYYQSTIINESLTKSICLELLEYHESLDHRFLSYYVNCSVQGS